MSGKNLKMMEKINHAAIMWNKTKDEKYKILWYQLIKEWANERKE